MSHVFMFVWLHALGRKYGLRYMNGSLPKFAAENCDLLYVCNKFRLKPGSLSEDGRWGGYMNGESTLPEIRAEKNIENRISICELFC